MSSALCLHPLKLHHAGTKKRGYPNAKTRPNRGESYEEPQDADQAQGGRAIHPLPQDHRKRRPYRRLTQRIPMRYLASRSRSPNPKH